MAAADFRLGTWLVQPSLNTISRNGASIHVEPKMMQVLVYLARQSGEAVSKDELLKAVWPDTFVTDDVLIRSISELRRILQDDAHEPRIIQTIPKRGYRLLPKLDPNTAPAKNVTRDSIAVLPFINLSSDAENEFLADGMTEEIINAMAQITELHVVARSSAFSFKGKHVDPRIIGQQLNVRTVLEGSVRRSGSRLRITAQLINATDGYHLWSERYDREMKDVFDIQDEISRSIADRLKITLQGNDSEPLVRTGTKNLEAYQLYLKGRALLYRRGGAIPRALECFERAVSLDPDYALAWAGLADAHTTLGYYGLRRPDASMPKGMEAAQRAVALGPTIAETHNALAMASWMGAWNKAMAEREFLHALSLNPRYIQARAWYALFYLQFSAGRLMEGVSQTELALECDPLSSYAHAIYSFTSVYAQQCEKAVQVARHAVELDSECYLAHFALQEVLHISGQFEESVAVGESALAMSGRHPWSLAILAVTLADWAKLADADAVYAEMTGRGRRQYVAPALLALAAAAASREDEAIRHASHAFEIRDPHCLFFLSNLEPSSARLHASPRFRQVLLDAGLS